MEGDGAKGVLTIRQNMDSNEVVIAVVNGQRDQAARDLTKPRLAVKPLYPQKTSVYTNTDHSRQTMMDRHVQICDDRYTSCYQVAHCSVRPTSPPVPISEFPPQRANPIYNEGNFEVGGYGSWQARGPCRANHFRGGLTWPDRGSVHCNRSSRDVDAFADSLRKYPSYSPDRSVSSELVTRLLRYTQAKYAQKTARTKSTRSLSNDKSLDRRAARKQSRYLQTSARSPENLSTRRVDTKREETKREVSPCPTRVIKIDRGTNSEDVVQRVTRKNWRNFRLRSPVSERNVNRNESNFSTKYDYLKAGQPRDPQDSEQLSIYEISRQMQSVIRQFYNPRPVVFQMCPRIQKRYLQHKKTCPVKNSATWMTEEADEEQASSSKLCRFLESINIMPGEPSGTDLHSSMLPGRLSYCHCTQSPQCDCEPKTNDKSNDKSTQCECCECLPFTNEAYYRNRIDEEIAKWFNAIPVQNNERSKDKKLRENLVKSLAENLKQLPDDEDFDANVKKSIEQCVDEMPMWYPGTKKDEEQMKKQLVEKLLRIITKIPRKADKLRDAVKNFINSINFIGDVDKKAITDNIVKNLKIFAFNVPKDGDEFEDLLIFEVTEMLDELPLQFRGIKSVVLNTLANKLADDVKDLLKSTDLFAGEDNLKYTFKEIISEWFEEVGEFSKELPNSNEVEHIINKLAIALDDLQSQGIDDITINKMEREISIILETLDVPVKISDELTNNLMDKVTDVVYARDKDKLDIFQKQETFKELNNWFNNLQEVDDLSPVEKYKLVKEIADIVEDTKDEKNKDYQVDILEKLDRLHINIDSDSLGMQLDEIKEKLKSLPDKVKKDDLIANMQKDFNDAIDKSDMSEDKKTNLKNKARNIIAENIEASSLATKRDIDDMREMLLGQIYDTIEHLPDNVQIDLKNKLNDSLDNYIDKMQSAKDKDTAKYALLKEINYIIDKEHVPEEEKNDIKYKMKHILKENFDQPFCHQVNDAIKDNIGNIVKDAQIESAQKDNLINKLMNTVDKTLDQLPTQSIKDHVKNKTIRDINKVIDKSQIPDNARDNIKQKLKNKVLGNFDQPFSTDIRHIILQDINEIIDVLPRSFKDDLKRKLTDVVTANLDKMPEQTTVDYTKESLVHDINDFLDDIPLPKEQLNDLKKKIEFTFAEFVDRPYTPDRRDKLNETFKNIIAESDIPSDEKDTILEKLIHITGKKLDQLPYQTAEEYAKETILRHIMHVLNELPLTTSEKKDLSNQFEDLIEESLRQTYLGEGRERIKEGIVNIIRDSSAPQPKKDEFIFKTLHAVSKILDESYYEDHVRDELEEFYDLIDKAPMHTAQKNILKPKTKRIVDDHTLDSEFGNVKDMIKEAINLIQEPSDMSLTEQESNIAIDESIIEDIINATRASSLPSNKKTSLEYKVNTLVEELKDPEDLDRIVRELQKIVDEIPLPSHDKKVLKYRLAMAVSRKKGELNELLKYELIKDMGSAVDLISLGKEKNIDLKSKIKDFVTTLDKSMSGNLKDNIQDGIFKILDKAVYSEDKKHQLRDRIISIIDKLPTESHDQNIINERLLSHIGDIIEETPIRQHIKKNIKAQIGHIISENSKQPYKKKTNERMKTDIVNIINEAPITEYQKRTLNSKINQILGQLTHTSGNKNTLIENINSILDDEPLPKVKKSELKKKIYEHLTDFDETTSYDEKNKTIKSILKIIDDTVMPKDNKANIKDKLENILTKQYFEALPSSSDPENNLLTALDNSVSKVLDDALIPQYTKTYLKKRMKTALPQILQQPMSSDIEEPINQAISNIMDEVALSKAEKDIIKNKLVSTVFEKLGKPWPKSEKHVDVEDVMKPVPPYDHTINDATSDIKPTVMDVINSIFDELNISTVKKEKLKHQIKDRVDESSRTPQNSDMMQLVKDEMYDIINEAPIPRDKKSNLKNKLCDMIDNNTKFLPDRIRDSNKSYKPDVDVKIAITDEIDSMLDTLQMNKHQKDNLKHQVKDMLNKTLEQPINDGTIQVIKNTVNDIISEAPIPREKKNEFKRQLSGMIDTKVRSILDKSIRVDRSEPSMKLKIDSKDSEIDHTRKKYAEEEIDSVVGQLQIPNELKILLKQKLKDKADEDFKIRRKSSARPHRLKEDTNIFKPAAKVQEEVTEEMNAILDQIQIKEPHKSNLKKQVKEMMDGNFKKPIDSDTLRIMKNNINNLISEAPIQRDKKIDIKKQISDMVESKVKLLPEKKINYITKPVPEVKPAITKGIDTTVKQLDMNKNQKEKRQLNDTLAETSEEPINSDTLRVTKTRTNDIIFEAPIPRDKKAEIRKEISNMTDSNVEYLPDKSIKHKNKRLSEIKAGITADIDSIVNQLGINKNQKDNLKHQLNDMVAEYLGKPIDSHAMKVINNETNDMISEAPIPRDMKADIGRKISNVVDNRVKPLPEKSIVYKNKRDSEVQAAAVREDKDLIVNQPEINKSQEDSLKHQLNDTVAENLEKPTDVGTLRIIKKRINDIISKAPISREKKAEIFKKISDIVDDRKETMPSKNVHYKDKRASKVKAAVMKDIDSIVNQLDINKNQKDNLIHQLNDTVAENLEKPIDDETLRMIKNKINDIISKAPISREKKAEISGKLFQMVDNRVESLPDKSISYKDKRAAEVKAAVIKDIESIVNQLDINKNQKDNLKHQLNEMLNEDLQKPIEDDTLRDIKKRINDIISDAPIPREKKAELIKKIADMVENRVESLPDKSISYKDKQILEVKAAVMKDIDSIVNQLDINKNQKDNLKHQLNEMVNEDFQKPIDDDTLRDIKKRINYIISKAPISREQKAEISGKLSQMVDNRLESLPHKNIRYKYKRMSEVKAAVTKDIDSIVNKLDINRNQKDNLKHQLNDMVNENLQKPVDDDTLRDIKKRINDIISDAPIPREKKAELKKKIADIVENRVKSLPDKSIKYKDKRVSAVKAAVTKDIDSIVNQLDISKNQKDNLKQLLNDMVAENLEKPINDDTLRNIKKRINDIISKAPISREQKAEISGKLSHMVDSRLESLPDKNIRYKDKRTSEVKAAVTKDINSNVNQLDINRNQKDNLKHQLNEMVNEDLQKTIDNDTLRDIKKRINDIISDAPIPKEKKAELGKKIADMLENRVESLPDKSFSYKDKRVSEAKAAVTKDINSIVNQLDINKNQKDNLKHQLIEMFNENLQKPIDDDTLRDIKKRINDIISEAPIPRDKKAEMRNKISDLVASKVESLFEESVNYKTKRVSNVKAAVTDDIDSIVNQQDINKTQKDNLKHQLTENLDKPITSDTVKVMKNKISDIIANAPISRDIKNNLRKILSNMLDDIVEPSSAKTIGIDSRKPLKITPRDFEKNAPKFMSSSERNNIMQVIDSTLDEIQLPNDQKKVLKQKLKNKIDEYLREPLLADTLNHIKADINNIIAEAPISKEKKAEIREKMSNKFDSENIMKGIDSETFMDSKRKADVIRPDRSYGSNGKRGIKPETVVIKHDALRNINGVLQKLQIPSDQKLNIISKINDKIHNYVERPMSIDTLQALKDEIDNIIAEIPMANDKNIDLRNQLFQKLNENTEPFKGKSKSNTLKPVTEKSNDKY